MGYLMKHSNRHFQRATLSRSISSVNHTTARHEFSIPALGSLASRRWTGGLCRNTNAYRVVLKRVLAAEMRRKTNFALARAVAFGFASWLLKS